MEKIKQKVEQVLHKDSNHGTTHHDTTTHGTTHHGTTTHGTTTGAHHSDPNGPHDSRTANKLDPRIDASKPGPLGDSAGAHSHHNAGGNTHVPGTHGHGTDPRGPHDSRLANAADPNVSRSAGGAGSYGHPGGLSGSNTHGSDPNGPHQTRMANALDPRVSSDKPGNLGDTTGAGGYGHSGNITGSNTHGSDPNGPHKSHAANVLDPRVSSDKPGNLGDTIGAGGYGHSGNLTGSNTHGHYNPNNGPHVPGTHGHNTTGAGGVTGTHGHNTTGAGITGSHLPGPADRTAGPHSSNIANKLDPTVDSDLDGSKKIGGDRTFG